ncbi:MAG: beta-lactamase family protein [Eudoraea sp.]|nr:beta-lactamase family protein [Eudoraea sp.]MBT8222056.1 beta-lactamase family protein [Eudoraea sp.]
MNRLKILIITSIFLIALLGLTNSFIAPAPASGSDKAMAINQAGKELLDPRAEMLYQYQKQELKKALKAYFDKAISSGQIVGAGVSIVKGDAIVISEGFGKRNIRINEAVDGQTIFRLGSLSKGFAGILAANLKNEGKLAWEDRVSDYIPEFTLGDKSNTDKITLANLLSHTSGAPYHSFTNLVEAGLPLSDIAKRFKEVKPISSPGEIYSYQNALFALSGEMMYKATGQDIIKSLKNRFFNPLEMCATTMDYETLAKAENVAIPHTKWRRSWRPRKLNDHYYNAIAAGGISANAMDMGRWMRFILGHNPDIMGKQAIQEAFMPVVEIKGRSKYYQRWPGHLSSHYGFGWRIHKFVEDNTRQEKTIWHHGGSVNNYRNEIAIFPEADLGICVLFNSNSRLAKNVVPDLYDIVKKVYKKTTAQLAFNRMPHKPSP